MKALKIEFKKVIPYLIICISLTIALISKFFLNDSAVSLSYTSFLTNLNGGNVKEVFFDNNSYIEFKMTDKKTYKTDNPRLENFKEMLLLKGVKVIETRKFNPWFDIPIVIFISGLLYLIVVKASNTKELKNAKEVDHLTLNSSENINILFDDVAGNYEAKESLKEVVDFLKNPEKFSKYGARLPRGVMLYGDPGNGKTLIAKACAGESNVPFYALSGSDFVQVYVGVGASRIRKLFSKAKSHGKAVIFIDEIDAIGKKRSNSAASSDERDQTLNALLTEMSGFSERDGIVVIAATNRLDVLDDALLRPGRFDRHIEISMPDFIARKEILSLHLKNKPIGNIDLDKIAKLTSFFSGSKLESLTNEAAILACKENASCIDDTHLDRAFSIVMAGYEKTNYSSITDLDKKITSYHEIGHALLNMILIPEDKVSKVTIIPTSKGAGGYTMSIAEDKMYYTKDYIKKKIMILLGGRAAEEIMFGEENITTGAHNDIQKVSDMLLKMITEYGMGHSIGLMNYSCLQNYGISSSEIFNESKKMLDELYKNAKDILIKNKNILCSLSDRLLSSETLYEKDLYDIA